MILLWGDLEDRPFRSVIGELKEKKSTELIILDQRRLSESEIEMSVTDCISGYLYLGNRKYDLTDISSAYLRPYSWTALYDNTDSGSHNNDEYRHEIEIEKLLISWVEIAPAMIINRFSSMASNGSKPYQASIIKKYGFKTPATIITNSPDDVKNFRKLHVDVIYKSISGVRSIVSRLTHEKMKNLNDIIWAPTQFQQYVNGTDIRVHVIGNSTICSEIITDADDYRYAVKAGNEVKMSACEIPDEYNNKCIELVKDLGLVVGGVDLRLTPDNEWYCFEVNPSPGFTYYQSYTGQDIASAIADLMILCSDK